MTNILKFLFYFVIWFQVYVQKHLLKINLVPVSAKLLRYIDFFHFSVYIIPTCVNKKFQFREEKWFSKSLTKSAKPRCYIDHFQIPVFKISPRIYFYPNPSEMSIFYIYLQNSTILCIRPHFLGNIESTWKYWDIIKFLHLKKIHIWNVLPHFFAYIRITKGKKIIDEIYYIKKIHEQKLWY